MPDSQGPLVDQKLLEVLDLAELPQVPITYRLVLVVDGLLIEGDLFPSHKQRLEELRAMHAATEFFDDQREIRSTEDQTTYPRIDLVERLLADDNAKQRIHEASPPSIWHTNVIVRHSSGNRDRYSTFFVRLDSVSAWTLADTRIIPGKSPSPQAAPGWNPE